MADMEETRFRSFAERYVIERAGTFRMGEDEIKDAWECILKAKTTYKMIHSVSGGRVDPVGEASPPQQFSGNYLNQAGDTIRMPPDVAKHAKDMLAKGAPMDFIKEMLDSMLGKCGLPPIAKFAK